jgi:outer membrane protein assembly factor BamB
MFAWPADGGNWPQFRGPDASGVDLTHALPTRWDLAKGENARWQTPIPGLAHASPVVWGDRIYVATAVAPGTAELKTGLYGDVTPLEEQAEQQWRLLALDKSTGRVAWDTLGHQAVPRVKRHPKASHCNSTPATDGQHIAAIFGSEGLFCFDAEGRLRWRKDLGPMDSGFFSMPSAQWGFASSPIIHDGKVIVQCDVLTSQFIAAFDAADGRELWRTSRKDVPTWSTPTFIQQGSREQVVVNGWHETAGYDFTTGRKLWHLEGGGDIPVPTPVFANSLIYLTSAHGRFRPLRAIRADASGDITPTGPGQTNQAIAWAHARQGNYMQTPIVVDDLLFACADNGVLTCASARTGEINYSERLTAGGMGFSSSPVSDGRNLYFASEPGKVFVVAASEKFSVMATNDLQETCMATPAVSDGMLLYRTRTRLVAIGGKADQRP